MKRALILAASVAALTGAVHAAPASKPITGNHDNNAPINISSDNFQADLNAKSGTYTGNVIVVQGDTKLRANPVRVTHRQWQSRQDHRQRQCGGGFAHLRHRDR